MNKLIVTFIGGMLTAVLESRYDRARHSSNTLVQKLRAFDRKLYLDGKRQADLIENIKDACDKK